MMTAMVKKIIVFVVIVLVICVGGVWAANELIYTEKKQDVLVGLKGVLVAVETFHPDTKETGLTKEQIQTDVELKLRLAGIKVLSKEDGPYEPIGKSFLYVNIKAIKPPKELPLLYGVGIKVSLIELVHLARNPKILTYADTWNKVYVGLYGCDVVQDGIRGTVKDLIDSFINDYLAANPKEPAMKEPQLPTEQKK